MTGTDVQYKEGNTNVGLGSGYILKLSADANSSEWSINDSADVFMLPHSWVNVTAIADPDSSKAAIIIQDEDNIYFSGEVAVNGKGIPEGLYLRWGCTQSLVSVDNVKVLCAN